MFRFGAAFSNEVNSFESTEFAKCESLRKIPGMVGMIPGKDPTSLLGLIGLSTYRADREARYTSDQTEVGLNLHGSVGIMGDDETKSMINAR